MTVIIVAFEQGNNRLLSGFATLIPVFTLVAYFFIGETRGGAAVSQHAWLVLVGTLVSWVPYMIAVAMLAPKIGSARAIFVGMSIFFVCASIYLLFVSKFKLFQ